MRSTGLASLGRGFEAPAASAQQTFRCVLEAMARPGQLQRIAPPTGLDFEPPGIGRSLCALLLTLLDAETRLCIDAGLPCGAIAAYLRFHTGVRMLDGVSDRVSDGVSDGTSDGVSDKKSDGKFGGMSDADFAVLGAAQADAAVWTALRHGNDEAPQDGATLILEVPGLAALLPDAPRLRLRGPGIRTEQSLCVAGTTADFWRARQALEREFPRGVDLLLCCGDLIAALPRSTRIELEA